MRAIRLLSLISITLALGYVAHAEDPKPPASRPQAGVKALQGTWKVVRRSKNGHDEDAREHPTFLRFEGTHITETQDGMPVQQGTFDIDMARRPWRMTMTGTEGPNAGSVFQAIYELKKDTLKLAYGAGSHADTPPKDFAGGEGVGVLVLERDKP